MGKTAIFLPIKQGEVFMCGKLMYWPLMTFLAYIFASSTYAQQENMRGRILTGEKIIQMKSDPDFHLDSSMMEYSKRELGVANRILKNRNKILFIENTVQRGFLFYDIEDFKKFISSRKAVRSEYEFHFKGMIAEPSAFLRNRDNRIIALAKLLNIPVEMLDFSAKSIALIDSLIENKSKEVRFLPNENIDNFKCLLTYLGEYIYSNAGLDWDFFYHPDLGTYWPVSRVGQQSPESDDWVQYLISTLAGSRDEYAIRWLADFKISSL